MPSAVRGYVVWEELDMWIAVTVIGIIAAPFVVAARLARRRRRRRPTDQPVAVEPDDSLPDPGTDEVPRRPDGSLVPGSEPHRNRRGQP